MVKFVLDRKGSFSLASADKTEDTNALSAVGKKAQRKGRKKHALHQAQYNEQVQKSLQFDSPSIDPWNSSQYSAIKDKEVNDEWHRDEKGFDVLLKKKLRNVDGRGEKSLKTSIERKGIRKQIALPESGASYNPEESMRQAALLKALEISNELVKDEEELKKKMQEARENYENNTCEIEESDDEEVQEQAQESGEGDKPYVALNRPVLAEKRKTRVQRNKQKKLKDQLRQIAAKKEEKVRLNQLHSLKSIGRSIKEHSEKMAQIRAKIREMKSKWTADQWAAKLRLGNSKFQTPVPEVAFAEDLGNSLRSVKPRGSLLSEQFKRMQKFGVIENVAQVEHITVRGSAYKQVTRRSYKQDVEY